MFNKFLSFILALSFSVTLFFTGIKEADASVTIGRPPTNNLGLVGYWTMDGKDINWATNTIVDKSGNGNTGQLTNMSTTTSPTDGKLGQALQFDGTSSYINIGAPASLNLTDNYTISFWIYRTGYTSQNGAIRQSSSFSNTCQYSKYDIRFGETSITFCTGDGTTSDIDVFTMPTDLNKWTYYTCTLTLNDVKECYQNGVSLGTATNDVDTSLVTPVVGFIGTLRDVAGNYTNGIMDDVRIYNRVLSADEVGRLYRAGQARVVSSTNSLVDTGLVVRYYLDEAGSGTSPTQINDSSGNDYHLTEINYGSGNMSWTEVGGNRGLESTSVTGTQRARRGITSSAGDHIYDTMHATQKATVEVVVKLDSSTANVSRIFAITDRVGSSGRLGFLHDSDGNGSTCTLSGGTGTWLFAFAGNFVECFGEVSTAKAVYHIVYDTTQSSEANRVLLYKNGSLQTSGSGFLAQNSTLGIPSSHDLIMFNRENSGSFDRSFDGILYYGAIYNHAFTQDDVTANYNILRYNDDSPKGVTVNSSRIPSQSSLNNGLVGHWTFDGKDMNWATNQALDISGNGWHGNLANMSTSTSPVPGKFGQALRFGGANPTSGSHVRVPSITKTASFSYSMWIKLNSAAGGGGWRVLVEWANDNPWFGFGSGQGGRIELYSNNPRTTTQLQVGPWYHVVLTSGGGVSKIYINGVQDGPDGTGNTATTVGVGIGCHFVDPCFDGIIDDVRIYNRVLSADEVKQLYNMGK